MIASALVLSAVLLGQQEHRPGELADAGNAFPSVSKAVRSPLKRSWFSFEAEGKEITIKRRERLTVDADWSQQVQRLSVSYEPVDVRSVRSSTTNEIAYLYVCGVNGPGRSVIEEWRFAYPPASSGAAGGLPGGGGGRDIPLGERSLPAVRRTVVLEDPSVGVITSFDVDPERRFLHFLTYPRRELYRVALSDPVAELIFSPATLPDLDGARSLRILEHSTEGRQLHVYSYYRWEPHGEPGDLLILHDPRNTGVFDSPEVITPAEWASRNYSGDFWNLFYR